MSVIFVDCDGKRIKTDILTAGYLREEIEDKYKIRIPSEIKRLCFDYWFINICDKWDKTTCDHKLIEISGQIIEAISNDYQASILGCNCISNDQFEWILRLIKNVGGGVCIGIIKNLSDDEVSKYRKSVAYYFDNNGGCWTSYDGKFYGPSFVAPKISRGFSDEITENVIIKMKIDFDLECLYYSIDGDEYVKTSYKIDKNDSYRLVVSFIHSKGHQVELL